MKTFRLTSMVIVESNCKKADAELLLLGAKPVDLDEFPKLKYVFRAGVGCDAIPVGSIEERGIKLFFPSIDTRHVISKSVAYMTFGQILTERTLNTPINEWYREPCNATWEKRILAVGEGRVGAMVKKLCEDARLRVDTYEAKRDIAEPVWKTYDIITFHVPLVCYEHGSIHRDNTGMINARLLTR